MVETPGIRSLCPGVRPPFTPGPPQYNSDQPLAAGTKWLTTYGVTGSADNLQRITVDGFSNNQDWLHLTITRPGAAQVLTWDRVPYTS